MKPYKILLFIIVIIAVLGLISAFFPKEGVKIGDREFYFSSFEDLARRNDADDIQLTAIDSVVLQAMMELQDTMAVYQQIITENEGRFFFPNEDDTFFDTFFTAASKAQKNGRTMRLLHYGDSQIEMDRISENVRAWFQKTFGGGGPGMLPLEQTIPTVSVSQYVTGDLIDYGIYGTSARIKNRQYGAMARFYRISGTTVLHVTAAKSDKIDERLKKFSKITLIYKNHNIPFSATLKDKTYHYEQKLLSDTVGVQKMVWHLDSATSKISLTFTGEADIYGITVDNGCGIALDNIPIRGSSGTFFSSIEDSTLRMMYDLLDVGMIILQFGGNSVPGISGEKSIASYTDKIAAQIRYFKQVYPKAKILFIGPSDMSTREGGTLQTYPQLPNFVKALKQTVTDNDAAFWDIYTVMGGHNSMLTWVQKGWATNDYIHFSASGAKKIGDALANNFQIMYNYFLLRQEMDMHQQNSNLP